MSSEINEKQEAIAVVERLKDAMAARRMKIGELADLSSVGYRSLQNYLSGKHKIPAVVLKRMAEALGVSADWLLSGQAANLNLEYIGDCLDVIGDVQAFDQHKTPPHERAQMFASLYQKLYAGQFYLSPLDRKRRHRTIPAGPRSKRGG